MLIKFFGRLGAVVQGIVLGLSMLGAVFMMMQIGSGARVFYYQGF
jgi:hypothetical protein